jgi:hypothetical protein
MRATRATLLAVGLVVPLAAAADEITDELDQARSYYDQGDLTGAIGELEFALQAMRGKIGAALLATFPPAPAGWTIDAADAAAPANIPFVTPGSMLSRTYRTPDGANSIEAQLMSGGGLLQGLAGMLMNPQLLAAQPNAKRVRIGRDNAVLTVDADDKSAQLVLDLGGKGTLMLQGKGVSDGDPLIALANAWDLKQLKELLGG